MKIILHSKPWILETDAEAVNRVLLSQMIAQGKITREFENALSDWLSIENPGVAVGSGAAALVLALSALDVGIGDEVLLTTYLCPSVLEAVITTGATPILCDVGPNWVVTPENIEKYITHKTKSIIVAHMYGVFADVESFEKFGIPIIEDCAQGIDYKGKRSIKGDIGVFSFHPTKCLTTGEGGMVVSADLALANKMRTIRDGEKKAQYKRLFSPMSDLAASLGISQLSRYHEALNRRKILAFDYESALKKIIPESLESEALENSMFFRFPIKISGGVEKYQGIFTHKRICVRRGVDKLLHRFLGAPDTEYEEAVRLFESTVSLPIYPALSDAEHSYCIETAIDIFSRNC